MLALMISLLLCGCGGQDAARRYVQWQENYSQDTQLYIKARVGFSRNDDFSQHLLEYSRDREEETVTVLEPTLIGGVTAHFSSEDTRLSYDSLILDSGPAPNELSPISALPAFTAFILEGHPECSWTETVEDRDLTVTELELQDGSKMTLWQLTENMSPVYAEIRTGSVVEATLEILELSAA